MRDTNLPKKAYSLRVLSVLIWKIKLCGKLANFFLNISLTKKEIGFRTYS